MGDHVPYKITFEALSEHLGRRHQFWDDDNYPSSNYDNLIRYIIAITGVNRGIDPSTKLRFKDLIVTIPPMLVIDALIYFTTGVGDDCGDDGFKLAAEFLSARYPEVYADVSGGKDHRDWYNLAILMDTRGYRFTDYFNYESNPVEVTRDIVWLLDRMDSITGDAADDIIKRHVMHNRRVERMALYPQHLKYDTRHKTFSECVIDLRQTREPYTFAGCEFRECVLLGSPDNLVGNNFIDCGTEVSRMYHYQVPREWLMSKREKLNIVYYRKNSVSAEQLIGINAQVGDYDNVLYY